MSNGLLDVMKYCADEKVKSANIPHYVSGVITSVSEDMFRADIKLEQDQVLKNMLNKSGEELEVGDTVWVEYFTYPSSGWIARRNGKPKPMGGGGSATTVENATILDNSNFHDYNIVERMDIAVTPAVNLYYGNLPNFVCVQGNFMLYLAAAAGTVIDYDNGYIIDEDSTLYGRILANKDKFGCQIGTDTFGGFLHTQATGKNYPSVYSYVRLEITIAEYNNDKYDYQCRFVEYNAATNAPQPEGANWWETNMQWGNSTATQKNGFRLIGEDNVRGLDGSLQHVFAVPVTRELNYNTAQSSLPTPFGRVTISYWLVFASSNGTDYGITVVSASGAAPLQAKVAPFRSQAEKTFSLGLTKRTEPVQPT